MNRIPCNTIRDLIPLYIESICSEESGQLIEEHVAECEKCRAILEESMRETDLESVMKRTVSEDSPGRERPSESVFQKILKRVTRKIALRAVLVVACILCVAAIVWYVYDGPAFAISFEDAAFSVHAADVFGEAGLYVDAAADHLKMEKEDDTVVIHGKRSYTSKSSYENSGQQHRYYVSLDGGTVKKIVYRDKAGEIYTIWEE